MIPGIARTIVSAGMATDDPAARPIKPLFPRLASGPGQMTPEGVARHQKARLQGAMVEAVARHGFAGTTLRELVALAGVSKTTFYEHFECKQDCFLATFDEIVAEVTRAGRARPTASRGLPRTLVAALAAFMELGGRGAGGGDAGGGRVADPGRRRRRAPRTGLARPSS